jgi:hypothetical protein
MTKGINQEEKILKAIQALYSETFKTSEKTCQIETDLYDIKVCLVNLIKRLNSLDELERKVFTDNLKH